MKIEIDDNSLIDEIVKRVVGQLKPMLNNSHNSVDDELMDVNGLAKFLKVKESWVYEKIHTREIPFRKVGKFPRFRKIDIDLWLINPYDSGLDFYNLNRNGKGVRKKC
jgi:excisionase family DNA binding protein